MATINDNIFFVGLMGAGKTTIGKLLAKKLKKTFYDTDHEIEKKLGVKVAVIFELEGEGIIEIEKKDLQNLVKLRKNMEQEQWKK